VGGRVPGCGRVGGTGHGWTGGTGVVAGGVARAAGATAVASTFATGGVAGGWASAEMASPSHPSPSQYRWVVGSAGSLYQPGSIALTV